MVKTNKNQTTERIEEINFPFKKKKYKKIYKRGGHNRIN